MLSIWKISQLIGLTVVYNLLKFQIDSLKIEVRMSSLDPDPKLIIPDPDPANNFGSDRIRIHNTGLCPDPQSCYICLNIKVWKRAGGRPRAGTVCCVWSATPPPAWWRLLAWIWASGRVSQPAASGPTRAGQFFFVWAMWLRCRAILSRAADRGLFCKIRKFSTGSGSFPCYIKLYRTYL